VSLRPHRLHRDSSRSAATRVLWTLRLLAEKPRGVSKRSLERGLERRFGAEIGPETVRSYLNVLQDAGFEIRDFERGRREMCALVCSPFELRRRPRRTGPLRRGPVTKYPVSLSADEHRRLRDAATADESLRVRARALVLLAADAGKSGVEIARAAGVTEHTVWLIRKRYREEGIESVLRPKARKLKSRHEARQTL
jgi:DNA-binding CsgD family transcriptional regulator